MEPPVPDKPVGLGELGINTDQLRGAGATGMSFGAEFDTIAEAAKKIDPTLPSDPAKLLETAKATIPASRRKGMSDEALLMFFLNLMGGRSRNFLRNVGDAGIAALGVEKGIRKEESEARKEEALAKYYEQMGAAAGKDPELVRTLRALGNGDMKKGIAAYAELNADKRRLPPEQLRLRIEAQVTKELSGVIDYKLDPDKYKKEFDSRVKKKLQEYGDMGLLGTIGGSSNVINWADIGKQ